MFKNLATSVDVKLWSPLYITKYKKTVMGLPSVSNVVKLRTVNEYIL